MDIRSILLKQDIKSQVFSTLLSITVAIAPSLGYALPQGGTVTEGSASISNPDGNTTQIDQSTQRASINWNSFNVDASELVRFNQPSSTAVTLNRITGNMTTSILGRIEANGQVFIINPTGVIFGEGSRVNVGAMFATTLDISDADFMNGEYRFKNQSASTGMIINHGLLQAASGGYIALAADSVKNEGVIIADYGSVNLVSGRAMTMDFDGDGLIQFAVTENVLKNPNGVQSAVKNSGSIRANGGQVILSAHVASDIFDQAVNNEGVIEAYRVINKGGNIYLTGEGANVVNSGKIVADAKNGSAGKVVLQSDKTTLVSNTGSISATANEITTDESSQSEKNTGGTIHLLGSNVGLFDQANIDASALFNGGIILIGGDFQGKNENVQNAEYTYVAQGASIKANSQEEGDGGKIIVWADKSTQFYGDISATGGAQSGDGGFAEVSGKEGLVYRGKTDLSAAHGTTGILLLDPATITITGGNNDGALDGNATFAGDPSGTAGSIVFSDTGPTIVYESELEGITGTNISLQATNGITVSGIFTNNDVSLANNVNLSMTTNADAQTGILLNGTTVEFKTAGTGSITLTNTGTSPIVTGQLTTTGTGGITINSNDSVTVSHTISSADTVDITGKGLTVNANITAGNDITLSAKTSRYTQADNVDVNAGTHNITVIGDLITIGSTNVDNDAFKTTAGVLTLRAFSDQGRIDFLGDDNTFFSLDNNELAAFSNGVIDTGSIVFGSLTNNGDIRFDPNSSGTTTTFTASAPISFYTSTANGISILGNITATNPANLTFKANDFVSYAGNFSINSGTKNINVIANTIFIGTNSNKNIFSTSGTVTIKPRTESNNMIIGGPNVAGFSITNDEINNMLTGITGTLAFGGSDSTGTLTIADTVNFGNDSVSFSAATFTRSDAATVTSGSMTISADNIDLGTTADRIAATGSVILQPITTTRSIGIAGAAGDFNLTDAELKVFSSAATDMTIGRSNGKHTIAINAVTLNETTTIRTPDGGSISVDGAIQGAASGVGLTLDGSGATTTLNANITMNNANITISDSVILNTNIILSTTAGVNGNISISGTTNSQAGETNNLELIAGTGTITLTGAVGTAAGNTNLGTINVSSSGGATFANAVTAKSFMINDSSGGATVAVQGDLNLTAGMTVNNTLNTYNVSLTGSSNHIAGDTIFNNSGTVTLGNNTADTFTFAGGLDTDPAGMTTIAGTINTNGARIDLGGTNGLTIAAASTINSDADNGNNPGAIIDLGAITGGGFALILDSGTHSSTSINLTSVTNGGVYTLRESGAVTFAGNTALAGLTTTNQPYGVTFNGTTNTIGGDTNFLNTGIVVLGNGTGDTTTFSGGLATTGNGSNPSSTSIIGTVLTNNTQIDLGSVNLIGNTTIGTGAGAGNINFNTINGASALVVNVGTGSINFTDIVGGTTPISTLTTTGTGITTNNITANITSTGDMTFGGASSLGARLNRNGTGGLINFTGTLGIADTSVIVADTIDFDAAVSTANNSGLSLSSMTSGAFTVSNGAAGVRKIQVDQLANYAGSLTIGGISGNHPTIEATGLTVFDNLSTAGNILLLAKNDVDFQNNGNVTSTGLVTIISQEGSITNSGGKTINAPNIDFGAAGNVTATVTGVSGVLKSFNSPSGSSIITGGTPVHTLAAYNSSLVRLYILQNLLNVGSRYSDFYDEVDQAISIASSNLTYFEKNVYRAELLIPQRNIREFVDKVAVSDYIDDTIEPLPLLENIPPDYFIVPKKHKLISIEELLDTANIDMEKADSVNKVNDTNKNPAIINLTLTNEPIILNFNAETSSTSFESTQLLAEEGNWL